MEQDNLPNSPAPPPTPFWRSRGGTVLIAFLAIGGLLLGYEHRAHIFSGDGVLIALLVACIAMHLFMHRGHHGRNNGDSGRGDRS
ncbi:DUF2933 domain-containing protein [Pelagibius sp. CAU 1746]|uniref:DUF2933 domain-containing protein n=1 Tax=Pelagibius sp. CAU 1746 TaxID=3140370 RepID=UPI00325BBEC5